MNYNLLQEPWLPCLALDGGRLELGIREALLRAHNLRALRDPSPLVTLALHRLLLAVLHRALEGPRSVDDWRTLSEAGSFDAQRLDDYLHRWEGRFDLFDDNFPFYQISGFEVKIPRPAVQLAQEAAGGNNPALFDHTLDEDPPLLNPACAARRLVANQAFALGGGVGPKSNLFGKHPNLAHAPLVGGATVLLLGERLFETLMLNLLLYNQDVPFNQDLERDAPAWERPSPPNPGQRIECGYLDLLTWQSRCVRLLPEEEGVRWMYYAQGQSLDADARQREPAWFYRLGDHDELFPVRLRPGRALWRDSDSLFIFSREDDTSRGRRPLAFRQAAKLRRRGFLGNRALWRCSLFGLASDQAKATAWAHEELPVPADLLEDEELVLFLQIAVQKCETVGRSLRAGLDCLAQNLVKPAPPGKTWPKLNKQQRKDAEKIRRSLQAEPRFWESLELPFKRFLCELPREPEAAVSRWLDLAKRRARRAFSEAASDAMGRNARELQARVLAERYLNIGLSRITLGVEGGGE